MPTTVRPGRTAAPRRAAVDAFPKTTAAKKALHTLAVESQGKTTGAKIDAIVEKAFGKYSKMTPDQAREASVALNAVKAEFKGFAATHIQRQLAQLHDRSS